MKKVLFFLFFICFIFSADAQFNPSRITVGGGLGLQFGDYAVVNIAPQVGYNLTNSLNVGAGINYSYYSRKYGNKEWKQTNNYFGMNLYARLYPVSFLVLKIQPEVNRMWRTTKHLPTGEKEETEKVVPSFLVGGGLRIGPMTAMIQYDVAQNSHSPYGDKLFYSLGYTFNF